MQPSEEHSSRRDWLAESLAQDTHLANDLRVSHKRLSDDEPLHEAMVSLDETLARVTELALEAHELVDHIEAPRRERVSSPAIVVAAPAFATAIGVYAVFFDKLMHPGIAIAAVGLFFTKRVLDYQRWRG